MAGHEERNHYGSLQRVLVVSGSTFDGAPYQIALEQTALTSGSSANIRKGQMLTGEPLVLAVKVFGEMLNPVKKELLVRELRFAEEVSLRHPSILAFLGTAIVGEQTAIVSLYMRNGNLMEYIKAYCGKKKLILQVADAVEFLHKEARLVHGDLKCANVLISDFGDALLADFGLSTFAEKSQFAAATMTAIRQMNTVQFAAPELLIGEGNITLSKTCESDLYAFAKASWIFEALSEDLPWPNQSSFSVMQKICSGQHPARPTRDGLLVSFSHSWWDACLTCWKFAPSERPSIDEVLIALRSTEPEPYYKLLRGASNGVYSPDGSMIFAGSVDGSILLFDPSTEHIKHLSLQLDRLDGDRGKGVAVLSNGQRIASILGRKVFLWDVASNTVLATMEHDGRVTCVAYSPDGAFIASGARGGTIQMWDAVTGAAVWRRPGERPGVVNCVSFSPTGFLASGSDDGTIRFWACTTGAELATLTPPEACAVNSISFSPDGTHLASACACSTVIVWDVHARRPVHILESNGGDVLSVAFSPSGKYVAAGSEAKGILVLDVQRGTEIGVLSAGDEGGASSLAFSPDGRSLISAFSFTIYDEHDLSALCERALYVWDWFE